MEPPPSFLHHPPRYVPLSRRPPHPPLNFSDDPNFHLPPPPPLPPRLPPPPLQSYRPFPPPPPPPYNPHRLQFNFIDDDPHRYSPPPRVRVSQENHLEPFRMRDSDRHELESSFRFRDDYSDRFKHSYTDDIAHRLDLDTSFHHNLDYYGRNSSSPSGGFPLNDSPVGSNLRTHDSFPVFHDNIDGNYMWRHPQLLFHGNLLEKGNNEFIDGDVLELRTSGRGRDIYESGGFNGRDDNNSSNRGRKKELFRNSRKKIQKKSALRRIQFPFSKLNGRNRDEGNSFNSANHFDDDLGPRSFRSRGNVMEGDRQGSLLDLDVSFKSNSLVAKAVVGSSGHEIDRNSKPISEKRKIASLICSPSINSSVGHVNSDIFTQEKGKTANVLGSAPTNSSVGHLNLNISTEASGCPASSYKDSKKSDDFVVDSVGGHRPQSSFTSPRSPENKTVADPASDNGVNNAVPIGTNSSRIKKKKKVLAPTRPEMKGKFEPTKEDGSIKSLVSIPPLDEGDINSEGKIILTPVVSVDNFDLQPSQSRNSGFLGDNEVVKCRSATVSAKDCVGVDFGASLLRNAKRKRNSSSYLSSPQGLMRTGIDESTVIGDGPNGSHAISSCGKSSVRVQVTITPDTGHIGDISHESCRTESQLLVQKSLVIASPVARLSVGDNVDNFSNPEKTGVQEGLTNVYDLPCGGPNNSDSDKGHVKLTIYDENANNSVTKIDKGFVHADNFPAEESRGYTTLVEGTVVTGLSNAKETMVHGVASEANASEFDKDLMDSDCRMPFPGITSPGNSSCPDGTSELLENLPIEEPMKHTVTGGSNSHTGSEDQNISNDREDGEIELCSPIRTDMPLEAVGKASATYKTLSCPAKDHTLTEVRIVGAVENFSLGSPPCTAKDSTFRSSSLSVDPFDCEFSSKGTVCSHDTSSKYMKMGEPSLVMSEEDTVSAGNCTSGAELPVNTGGEWAQIDNRDVGSNFETFSSVISSPYSVSSLLLFENNVTGAPLNTIGSREALIDCSLKFENGLCSLPRAEKDHKDFNAPPFTTGCHENSILCSEKGGDGIKVGAAAETVAEEKLWADSFQHRSSVKSPAIDTFRMPRVSGMEGDPSMLETDSLTFFSTALPVCTNGNDAPSTELCGKNVESESDKLSNMGCPYILPVLTKSQLLNEREGSPGLNSMKVGISTRKNLLPAAVPRGFSVNLSLKKTAPTSHISKPRTWHRSSSPSFPSNPKNRCYPSSVSRRGKSPTVTGDVPPAAYVRKGNTLVRRTPLIAVTPKLSHASSSPVSWNPAGINEMKKTTGDESKVNFSSLETSVRTDLNAAMGRANTPPLPCSTKISDCTNHSSGPGTSESLIDPPEIVISESESGPLKLEENMDLLKPSDGIPKFSVSHKYPTGQIDDSDSQYLNDGNLVSTNVSRVVYVKRKANQLIASPSSTDLSAQIADMTEALPSVGYYKRRKNQLIRKSMEIGKNGANKSLNSEVKSAPQITARSSVHRRIGRGLGKTGKPSRFSSVWMLQNASLKKENSLASQVWPYLFPWKRATYRKWFLHSRGTIAKNGSLTSIGRKLLHSRKRKTIYKRSTHGLSLRISKVLSVGGSSLKWSKSIERNSRKASKEATLAVAAVQMKKREKNGATDVTQTKHRNHSSRKLDTIELRPGERIFRVGSVRYKMDTTRWTLQRISDEGSLCSLAVQSGKDVKKSPVPRRLVIGNHEYVRIGNGNQLVRDPKKRTRIWAKERVRWSLHTARLRLARKNSYCQFFTRFGKCNKGDRKCPYIHDPDKIAVCTKFLKGSCSDSNCRLTHKVIPERMQDCSYFLQGLCTNETCPYRHVNVNPNASVCDGFLRGYCADGDECRKKHSYVCPVFESTGICPQGSKCKLHHPKNCSKGKRRQPSSEQKNARGRYFGSDSKHVSVLNSKITVSNKICAEGDGDGIFFREGKSTDFVPLDVSSDEEGRGGSVSNSNCELSCSGDGHPVDKDVEELIKPIGIMRKIVMKESSPAVGSSMEKTSS